MHGCNPQDATPCNALCQGTQHVDLAYCDVELHRELALDVRTTFIQHHAAKHAQIYQTAPCAILDMTPVAEAPDMPVRYPQYREVDGLTAFRVTYQCPKEA